MTPELTILAGGVFLAVAGVLSLAGFALLERFSPERRRLAELGESRSPVSAGPVASLQRGEQTKVERQFSRFVPKSPGEMGRLQHKLSRCGYHGYLPAAIYAISEVALPVIFGGAVIAWLGFRAGFFLALVAAAMGYLLPPLYVSRLVKAYKKEIRNGLADALDLLIVCIEAGSGLDQALMRSTEELAVSYPNLSSELGMITTEIRAGKPRLEAFKNFAERTKVEDVQSLVAMLVQTDRFGTSIAQALRTHADVLRTKRRQRAEEKAAKLGVKLVFPLVLCLFPALYVVTLGPAVIQFVRVFFGQVMNKA
jgi:tight adherence protein C